MCIVHCIFATHKKHTYNETHPTRNYTTNK